MASRRQIPLVQKETRLQCAYDKSHFVHPSRLQIHLTKCRKLHPEMKLKVCPLNSTHHVEDLESHAKHCKSQNRFQNYWEEPENQDAYLQPNFGALGPNLGASNTSAASKPPSNEPMEYWDDEPEATVLQDIQKDSLYKLISRELPIGLSKAKRKEWRRVDAERISRLQRGVPIEDLAYPTKYEKCITIREMLQDNNESQEDTEEEPCASGETSKMDANLQKTEHGTKDCKKSVPEIVDAVEVQLAACSLDDTQKCEKEEATSNEKVVEEPRPKRKKRNGKKKGQYAIN